MYQRSDTLSLTELPSVLVIMTGNRSSLWSRLHFQNLYMPLRASIETIQGLGVDHRAAIRACAHVYIQFHHQHLRERSSWNEALICGRRHAQQAGEQMAGSTVRSASSARGRGEQSRADEQWNWWRNDLPSPGMQCSIDNRSRTTAQIVRYVLCSDSPKYLSSDLPPM